MSFLLMRVLFNWIVIVNLLKWKKGSAQKLKPCAKHPKQVYVWAAILKRGPSQMLVFERMMEAKFYAKEILENTLLPLIHNYFPNGHCFQQDNDPKHTSRLATDYMTAVGIKW